MSEETYINLRQKFIQEIKEQKQYSNDEEVPQPLIMNIKQYRLWKFNKLLNIISNYL